MREYKTLQHTADIRLLVKGDTAEELFLAALAGMDEIINKEEAQKKDDLVIVKEINIASSDMTGLLVDFLSEVLAITHTEKAIFPRAEFLKLTDNVLEARIYGRKTDKFDEDIKAVTYHEAAVRRNDKGIFETILVFDI